MKLYEDTYGEFGKASDMTRPVFYARLAYNGPTLIWQKIFVKVVQMKKNKMKIFLMMYS